MKITYCVLVFFYLACLLNAVTVICDKADSGSTKKGKKSSPNGEKKIKKKKSLEQANKIEQEMVQQKVQELMQDSVEIESSSSEVRDILMNVLESEEMQKNKKAMRKKKIIIGVISALFSLALLAGGGFGGYALYKKKKASKPVYEFNDAPDDATPGTSDESKPKYEPWDSDKLPNFEK